MFGLTLPQIMVISGLLLALAELAVGIEAGLDLVAVGSILIASGFLGTATSLSAALVTAIILAVGYLVFGRRLVRSKLVITTKKTNIDKLIGKTGVVIRQVTPDMPGLVRIDDEEWRATAAATLPAKAKVMVESIEGVTLKVCSHR